MSVIRKLVANFGAISSVPRVSISGVAAMYQECHSIAADAYHRASIPPTVKSDRGGKEPRFRYHGRPIVILRESYKKISL